MCEQWTSRIGTWALAALASVAFTGSAAAGDSDGAAGALYGERCATCHDGGAQRAPDRASIKLLPPERIRAALTTGSMVEHARGLGPPELDLLVAYLSGPSPQTVAAKTTPQCTHPPRRSTEPSGDRTGTVGGMASSNAAFSLPRWRA